MKRIMGMLMAVCICFGLCMQASVTEAANWKTMSVDEGRQYQVDMDSIEPAGKATYRVKTRTVDKKGKMIGYESLYEYKLTTEKTLTYYGKWNIVGSWYEGKYYPSTLEKKFYPVAVWDKGDTKLIMHLNHTYGDGQAKLPNWTWFYSSDRTTYKIDLNSISKNNGVYSAWIEEHTSYGIMPGEEHIAPYEDYTYRRMDYKQDKQGRLWIRIQIERWNNGVSWQPTEWELAEPSLYKDDAQREYQLLKAYLG